MSTTDDLLKQLKTKSELQEFLAMNNSYFLTLSFSEYLETLLTQKGLKKSDVIVASLLHNNYAYEIFNGKKNPTKNKVLQLCFGFQLNLEESQRLLSIAGVNSLYPRNKRDSIIIHCLIHKRSLLDCNLLLHQAQEQIFE